jgi:hypothetical protein
MKRCFGRFEIYRSAPITWAQLPLAAGSELWSTMFGDMSDWRESRNGLPCHEPVGFSTQ